MRLSLSHHLLPIALVVVSGVAAYLTGLFVDFTYDGVVLIQDNLVLRQLWPPDYLWRYTRPLSFFSFALNHFLFGPGPLSYIVINIIIHLSTAIVLYVLVRVVCESSPRIGRREANWPAKVALVSSLLWVVHPLNSQAVAYIYQRQESLAGLFFIGALLAFSFGVIRARQVWFILSIISCAAGMLTKEVVVTAPFCILWLDLAVLSNHPRDVLKRWYWHLGLWLTLGILAAVMASHAGEYATGGIGEVQGVSRWQYFRSQPFSVARYIWLWVFPHGQCADALMMPVNDPWSYWPALAVALIEFVTIVVLIFKRPVWGFLLGVGFVVLSPTSSIIPIQDLYFEHRMYIPSMALAVLSAVLIIRGIRLLKTVSQWPLTGLVGMILILLITTTNLRNQVYWSEEAFWQDALEKSPGNGRAMGNYALALVTRAKNLTDSQEKQELFDQAVVLAKKSIRSRGQNALAFRNLAYVLREAGRKQEGVKYLTMARILESPYSQNELIDIGNSYRNDLPEISLFCYERAAKLPPPSSEIFNNLGIVTQEVEKDYLKAETYFQKAITINPRNANAHNSYGNLLVRTKRYSQAIVAYEMALKINPQLHTAIKNRVVATNLQKKAAQGRTGQ